MSLVKPTMTLLCEGAQRQCPGQHVRQRQEHQQPLALRSSVGRHRLGAAGLVEQVGVRQLAALGASGGARGVDQRRGVVGLQRVQPGGQLGRVDRRAGLVELRRAPWGPNRRCAAPGAGSGSSPVSSVTIAACCVGLGERQHGLRVRQHPAHLLGRRRLVDRHGDGADGQDREVDDRPLVAGGREDRHPVTGLHALRDQTQCGGTDLLGGLGARDVGPGAVDLALDR